VLSLSFVSLFLSPVAKTKVKKIVLGETFLPLAFITKMPKERQQSGPFLGESLKTRSLIPRCLKEFWEKDNRREILNRIDKAAKDAKTETEESMVKAFAKFLDGLEFEGKEEEEEASSKLSQTQIDAIGSLEQKLVQKQKKETLVIITDNPLFDVASLTTLLKLHCDRKGINYSSSGEYRDTRDAWERFCMVPVKTQEILKARIQKQVLHDHWPENDAHFIFLQYLEAVKVAEAFAKLEQEMQEILGLKPSEKVSTTLVTQ
jgi:hypothetical protein